MTSHPSASRSRKAPAAARAALFALAVLLAAAPPAAAEYTKEQEKAIAALPAQYRTWLEEVELIIQDEELTAFLALAEDYQRDAFVKRFWRVRDPYQDTARNEYQDSYEERVLVARNEYGGMDEDRSRMLLLNGRPHGLVEVRCNLFKPLEIWFYAASPQFPYEFVLIFYREGSRYRLWRPFEGIDQLFDTLMGGRRDAQDYGGLLRQVQYECKDGEAIAAALGRVLAEGQLGYETLLGRIEERPELEQSEWVETFASYSTELPPDARALPAELALAFPGRHQSRTVLEGTLAVPRQAAAVAELAGSRTHNFVLIGEVLREGELFDSFRYRFDLPVDGAAAAEPAVATAENGAAAGGATANGHGDALPLVFHRYLRPGDYRLVVRLEDLNGGGFFRAEREIAVPEVEGAMPPPPPEDPETARLLAEANAFLDAGETALQIVPPRDAIQTGYVRFDTLSGGDGVARVAFALDGDTVLTKTRPPYSVELDLGPVPHPRTLEAIAYDAEGAELARDTLLINAGANRFAVELVEPRAGKTYRDSLTAEAEVQVPDGKTVERVELFWNETRIATLYQEPWTQPVIVPAEGEIAYLRAVAYLTDGNSTEDLVFVNAPDYLEELDVQFVELYATALDREGRPVEGIGRADLTVLEDGVAQEIARFETVRDLPVHVTVLLDVSASMEERLAGARDAAVGFLEATIEPKDRAAVITFNDHPNLAVKFTNDLSAIGAGLSGVDAERGTSLYDALVFGLYQFNGVKGQRAMLVLSDGKDESSRFTWEQALEYARRAGVTVYTIALDEAAHKRLTTLAEATGGRGFLTTAAELPAVYAAIEQELRSKYLIAYQSANTSGDTEFRRVEVRVARPGVEIKTMQGYYP
ncbi:MAG TPA: VWA domain-containing protein [Thermoanaerobaculia bacterium]|nr:VWA domain-containing protein [Thermoanaerobaculia bacterium]